MEKTNDIVEINRDFWFTVRYQPREAYVDFQAYDIVAFETDEQGVPLYPRKGSTGSGDEVKDIAEAETIINGSVKWDGCCHLNFGDEDGYVHLCGKHSLKNLHALLDAIYCRAGQLMVENGQNVDAKEFEQK